jgi:hypothetical protein
MSRTTMSMSRILLIAFSALALLVTPTTTLSAQAADCNGSQPEHPSCFNVFVDKADRKDLYWASGSYRGSLAGYMLSLQLEDEKGDLVDHASKICNSSGSCYVGTESHKSGGNDSFCATLTATIGDKEVFSDTACRVV